MVHIVFLRQHIAQSEVHKDHILKAKLVILYFIIPFYYNEQWSVQELTTIKLKCSVTNQAVAYLFIWVNAVREVFFCKFTIVHQISLHPKKY